MRTIGLGLLLLLAGCPPADPCTRIRDLATSPAGLDLTQDEHPGWGQTECFQCHQIVNIHRYDCFSAADIDVAAIRDLIDPEDTSTCVPCHGANGVPEWESIANDTGATQ
jgi:hypothetical protein